MQNKLEFTELPPGTFDPSDKAQSAVRPEADAVQQTTLLRYDLTEMEVRWDAQSQTLWSFMTPTDQPKYTQALLRDMRRWQKETQRLAQNGSLDIRYLVLGCRHPGAFNLGGDLSYVADAIERGDAVALEKYGNECVDILHGNLTGLGMPIITIALLQGDAIGGGLESALSFNVVVA
jgi:DSF synthase